MIENIYDEREASKWVAEAGSDLADQELALRVYTSRIIGQNPDLSEYNNQINFLKNEIKYFEIYSYSICIEKDGTIRKLEDMGGMKINVKKN